MKFVKYPSLTNASREKETAYLIEHFPQMLFVVQEKIHGSNVSFWTDGELCKSAKRSGFLTPEEDFYNHHALLLAHEARLKALFVQLKAQNPALQSIAVFGELFGGLYPHANVPTNRQAVRCQKHIYYSPNNGFCAFDVLCIEAETRYFLNAARAQTYFETHDFLYTPSLFEGTLQEALAYDPVFLTPLPERLGLPSLKDNFSEGVVIKPAFSEALADDYARYVFKLKHPKYREHIKGGPSVPTAPPVAWTEQLTILVQEGKGYITAGRYQSVVSKLSEAERRDFGRLIRDYSADLKADFLLDHGEAYEQLAKIEARHWAKVLNQAIVEHIKTQD